ncbi:hypothetical protein LEMLEM_LOCUS11128 [Lemmus lemmus]
MHKWGSPVCSGCDSVCLLLCGGFVPKAAWERSSPGCYFHSFKR